MKQLLASQEQLHPALFHSLLKTLTPLMALDNPNCKQVPQPSSSASALMEPTRTRSVRQNKLRPVSQGPLGTDLDLTQVQSAQ